MKEIYQLSEKELYDRFGTADGLSPEEAGMRRQEYGDNVLTQKKPRSVAAVFFSQFADLLVVILIVAAVVSLLSGNVESTLVIFAVIVMNAVLGTIQYVKARKSLDSLKELSAPHTKVIRGGSLVEIPSREVVPGDVMVLEAGDLVAADGRILLGQSLQVNESSLTGESTHVDKKEGQLEEEAALGDRFNMVFSGSLVTGGRAQVLVTATGMDTEMGKIATLMNQTEEKRTPLQVSLDDFSRKLAILIMGISLLVLGLRIWQGEALLDSLMFAVALAVAAIPEALGSIVTIVQAMGTRKMAADQAIIKDLKAVESLGCVSVICSDKTGTLTQNRMTVQQLYLGEETLEPENLRLSSPLHRWFLYSAILNNDSAISDGKEIGDPTESCLLRMVRDKKLFTLGATEEDIREMVPRLEELPFDSDRKRMSSKCLLHGRPVIFSKGAVDGLLERTEWILLPEGVRRITKEDRERILGQNMEFSRKGLRVLAFAYRECNGEEPLTLEQEQDYIFIGLAAMMDPPREESKEAVEKAAGAGIRTVMITGDHKITAAAIAGQIGIYQEGDLAVTGRELDAMSEEELNEKLEKISVYARVSPENKIRIVDAWQRKGHLVAMTGDGVNDAPALKKADIGVAMGITGTEVSKDASAMILGDDNFATIIKAVLNGRNVYRNIMNAILFLLSGNLAAILMVLYCSVMALDTPFRPVHLLFINLLTDSLPALAIGMEPSDNQLLKKGPRDPKAGIFTREFSLRLTGYALLIALATFAGYRMGGLESPEMASTMAFAVLTLARLFHGFNCRSEASIRKLGLCSNGWSVAAFLAGTGLLAFVLGVPVMHGMFEVADLSWKQAAQIGLLAFLPTLFLQLIRMFRESFRK